MTGALPPLVLPLLMNVDSRVSMVVFAKVVYWAAVMGCEPLPSNPLKPVSYLRTTHQYWVHVCGSQSLILL